MDADAAAGLSRRTFLKVLGWIGSTGWIGGTLGWRGCGGLAGPRPAAPPAFFDATERETLEALVDRILPPDGDPGARDLGAARYIERLLTAFESDPPFLFAGGPDSGRQPFPDPATGAPSSSFPPDAFAEPIPPSPVQELAWRAELYGAEAAGLPPHLDVQRGGTLRGLRDLYREGLAHVDDAAGTQFGAPFAALSAVQQDAVLAALDLPGALPVDPVRGVTFLDLVIRHTLEGCFSAPEYGGNAGGAGWQMLGLEGDSQPLGYSIFSEAIQDYVERPDHPMSTPNPDELGPGGALSPRPLTADGDFIQQSISELTVLLEQLVPGACL